MIETDVDNNKKLVMFMNYIQDIIFLPLILTIGKSGNIKWYLDAAFAVHKYLRSHNGGFMTVGNIEPMFNLSNKN